MNVFRILDDYLLNVFGFFTTLSLSLQLLAQNMQIMPPTGQMEKLVELIC